MNSERSWSNDYQFGAWKDLLLAHCCQVRCRGWTCCADCMVRWSPNDPGFVKLRGGRFLSNRSNQLRLETAIARIEIRDSRSDLFYYFRCQGAFHAQDPERPLGRSRSVPTTSCRRSLGRQPFMLQRQAEQLRSQASPTVSIGP